MTEDLRAQRLDVELAEAELGARFDHVAVAAPRLRDLLPIYQDLLGGVFANGGDNQRVGYRALQLRYPDGSRIELMEPLPGSDFFDSFFARVGDRGGLHHVTFKVEDIERAIAAARARGYEPVGIYLEWDVWKEAFLHPRQANGVLVQLAQAAPGYPEPPREDESVEAVLAGRSDGGNGIPSP